MEVFPYLFIAAVVLFGPWVLLFSTRRRMRQERKDNAARLVDLTGRVHELEQSLKQVQAAQSSPAELGLQVGMDFVPFGGLAMGGFKMLNRDDTSPVLAAAALTLAKDPDPRAAKHWQMPPPSREDGWFELHRSTLLPDAAIRPYCRSQYRGFKISKAASFNRLYHSLPA